MNNRVILQVPMSKTLKREAELVCRDWGFSSLQETIRVILSKLARHELSISVREEEVIKLSPRAEKRYAKMEEDFRTGKNIYQAKDVDDLMRQLHDNSVS